MTSNPLGEVFEGLMKKFLKSYCVYSGPINCNVKNHDTMHMTVLMISKSEKMLKKQKQTNKQNKTRQDKKRSISTLADPTKSTNHNSYPNPNVIFAW
jgi:hypothetical protein